MFPLHATQPSRAAEALHATLGSRGFDPDDFKVEESAAPEFAQWLGVVGGILKVRCISTGDERIYSIDAGSAWLGAFLMDLGQGHFAAATRSAGQDFLPMSQLVPPRMNA
ncbi:MAG: hypothetical protein ABI156_10705 [Caldimonas sp.]